MRCKFKTFSGVLLLILLISGVLSVSVEKAEAQGSCEVTIAKNGFPESDIEFVFTRTFEGQTDQFTNQIGGTQSFDIFSFNTPLQIVEEVPPGWTLEDVECIHDGGFQVIKVENGVEFECTIPFSSIECTFINKGPANVPTLSQWGMIAAAAGLVLVGVFFAIKRKRAAVNS